MKRIACICLAALLLLCFAEVVSAVPIRKWTDKGNFDTNWAGDGTAEHPYEIGNASQLAGIAVNVHEGNSYAGKHFKLTNSSPGAYDLGAHRWYPIGTKKTPFEGTFDGNNCNICNLNISIRRPGALYAGLFGPSSVAEINDVGVVDMIVTVASSSFYSYIGGVVGYADNCNITNCYATGTVTVTTGKRGYACAGGLVGSVCNGSKITGCHATVEVTTTFIAGNLVGRAEKSNIQNCYATGTVNGWAVGGLVGYACDSSSITNCYATGTVTGSYTAGGLVGDACDSSSITNSVALNRRLVTRNFYGNGKFGRIIGSSSNTYLAHNYAWEGMKKNRCFGYNGESISDPWNNHDFFKNTLKFDENWIMGTHEDYCLPLLAWQPADSVPGDVKYLHK